MKEVNTSNPSKDQKTSLKETDEKYRLIAENADIAIVLVQDGKFGYVTPYTEQLIGYSLDELMQFKWQDLIHPDFRDMMIEYNRRRLNSEKTPTRYEFKIIRKDGQERWIDISVSVVEFNGKPAIIGSAKDITEKKWAEEALKQSEEDYRTLFKSAHDAIIVFEPENEIILNVNDRACEIYEFSRSEFIGMSLISISHDPELGCQRINETLKNHFKKNFETIH